MSIALKVYGVSEALRNYRVAYETLLRQGLVKTANLIVIDLRAATPEDTGYAANEWKFRRLFTYDIKDVIIQEGYFSGIEPGGIEIYNKAPYIGMLNEGHSEQAPAHFIERVMLKYGNPEGIIVRNIPET